MELSDRAAAGKISDVINYLNIDYENVKADPSISAKEKKDRLTPYLNKINECVAQLSRRDLIHQALNECTIGVNFALVIYKELSSVTGKLDVACDYFKSYKQRMRSYYKMLDDALQDNINERISQITPVERVAFVTFETPYVDYRFVDQFTKKPYIFEVRIGDKEEVARKEAEKAREKLISDLKDKTNYLKTAYAEYNRLIDLENDYNRSKEYGTSAESKFDDFSIAQNIYPIKSVSIRHGKIVDSIKVTYSDGTVFKYGGDATAEIPITDDRIVQISGEYNADWDGAKNIAQLSIKTGSGKTYGPYGYAHGTAFKIDAEDKNIISFYGSVAGTRGRLGIASLGIYYTE